MHILLKHTSQYFGILILTHKEFPILLDFINSIKKYYYILVHNGSVNLPFNNNLINLNMTTDSRCSAINCISYTSRNFLLECFNNKENIKVVNSNLNIVLKKYNINYVLYDNIKNFDYISVNRGVKVKKTLDLLCYIITFLKNNLDKRACFIILENNNLNDEYYSKIINLYNTNKLPNLCFIDTHNLTINNPYYKGFTSIELSYFYKSSNIYMHGCESEGESRTIHEALCCGCMILAKDNMKGGGLDNLNNNSILYNNNNVFLKMTEILNLYKNYIFDNILMEKLNEVYTINNFLNLIYYKLEYSNILFENFKILCDTTNLMFKLPGHDLSVKWYIKNNNTADVKTDQQIGIVYNILFS